MKYLTGGLLTLVLVTFLGCQSPEQSVTIIPQAVRSEALFVGSIAVSDDIAWFSGTAGTYAYTADGGETWQTGTVPGADSLQLRDVHAFDASNAFVLSIGTGSQSRVYSTSDGGASWTLRWTNPEPEGFFDCMDFWDREAGILYGDSVDGHLMMFITEDGGRTWRQISPQLLPDAQPGEGGFASSGTCVRTAGDSTAWIGTGNGSHPRVLKTTNRGRTWTITEVDLPRGNQAGIFSLSFLNDQIGVAVGGDLQLSKSYTDNVVATTDGGTTWLPGGKPNVPGVLYGSSYVPGARTPTLVVVGPNGADYSRDNGSTWTPLDSLNYWTTAFSSPRSGWIAGTEGRINKVVLPNE